MAAVNEKLSLLPDEPGVYLLKGAQGQVIYVGKASSLRSRVRSYFQASAAHHSDPKIRRLRNELEDFETIVTASDREALILEDTLIKRHKPYYNAQLRDDKRYPYLKLTHERYPRLISTRQVEDDVQRGAQYFGPYTNVGAMHVARKTVQEVFHIRTCSLDIDDPPVRSRPCLDHYIGLCDAPCVGWIDEEAYRELVREAALFLRGRHDRLLPKLRDEMEEAAHGLEFERAGRLRDRIRTLERLQRFRKTVDPKGGDRDAISLHMEGSTCAVQVFFIRNGKLVGRDRFSMKTAESDDRAEVLAAFVKQYYGRATFVPQELLLQHEIDDEERSVIEDWLSERRGSRVYIKAPKRGPKAQLIEVVARNAELAWREEQVRSPQSEEEEGGMGERAEAELAKVARMEASPVRIEGFDISNIRGADPVASVVAFEQGKPDKSGYRRFNMAGVEGPDDYAMMAEAVRRRLVRAQNGDEHFLPLPDLLLIDGGKGQLSAVCGVLEELDVNIAVLAIAKEHELLFRPGRREPLILPRNSPALQLLQRVRDEAHRFALAYHVKRRGKQALHSILDEIPGVGPARKRALLERFGSLKGVREATLDELRAVPGLPESVARRIHRELSTGEDPVNGSEAH